MKGAIRSSAHLPVGPPPKCITVQWMCRKGPRNPCFNVHLFMAILEPGIGYQYWDFGERLVPLPITEPSFRPGLLGGCSKHSGRQPDSALNLDQSPRHVLGSHSSCNT